jgi:hypothetical protein
MTVKNFKRRDSATSVLRKLGVSAKDYAKYITKLDDGTFSCDVARASEKPKAVAKPKAAELSGDAPEPKVKETKVSEPKSETVSSVARKLIVGGKTNLEVWDIIKERFGLDDAKRGYPAWYRGDMRRKGLIS